METKLKGGEVFTHPDYTWPAKVLIISDNNRNFVYQLVSGQWCHFSAITEEGFINELNRRGWIRLESALKQEEKVETELFNYGNVICHPSQRSRMVVQGPLFKYSTLEVGQCMGYSFGHDNQLSFTEKLRNMGWDLSSKQENTEKPKLKTKITIEPEKEVISVRDGEVYTKLLNNTTRELLVTSLGTAIYLFDLKTMGLLPDVGRSVHGVRQYLEKHGYKYFRGKITIEQ